MPKFTTGEALKFAWQNTKANFWPFAGFLIFLWILSSLPSWLTRAGNLNTAGEAIIQIIGFVVQMLVSIGFLKTVLKVVDGGKIQFSEAVVESFRNTHLLVKYFLGTLLYGLTVLLGLILLIVPGFIWLLKYMFTGYLVVDKGMKPVEAWKESALITEGSKWELFKLWLISLVISIVGALLFGVGLFVAVPIVVLAQGYVYRKLSNTNIVPAVATPVEPAVQQ